MRIEPGHPDYERLLYIHLNGGGERFIFKGQEWMAVTDGDIKFFVLIGAEPGINSHYDKVSINAPNS
jgi:hypothetical protein